MKCDRPYPEVIARGIYRIRYMGAGLPGRCTAALMLAYKYIVEVVGAKTYAEVIY